MFVWRMWHFASNCQIWWKWVNHWHFWNGKFAPQKVSLALRTMGNVSLLCLIIANLDYISLQIWAKKWPLIIIPAIYWYNILATNFYFFAKFESCDFTPLIQRWNFSLTTYKLKSNLMVEARKSGYSYKSFSRVLSY